MCFQSPTNFVDFWGLEGERPTPAGDKLHTSEYYRFRYNDFVERHKNDEEKKSPPTYYLEYGDYNLRIFEEETYEQLSPKGKVWLTRTRNNLQDAMENLLMSDDGASLELNDNTFTQMAMATHANAYRSAGLGELPLMDLVKIGLSPDIKHLATGASVSQISEICTSLFYWTMEIRLNYP